MPDYASVRRCCARGLAVAGRCANAKNGIVQAHSCNILHDKKECTLIVRVCNERGSSRNIRDVCAAGMSFLSLKAVIPKPTIISDCYRN